MTYSLEHLAFRVVAGVVNTAARAANGLLEVMYPPRYDVAHIWDELAAPCADPHPAAGVADPAGGTPPPPAGSLSWFGWCYPAIVEALADHGWRPQGTAASVSKCRCGDQMDDEFEWRDHVSVVIADRIGCDPARAIAALQNLQTQE